MAAFRAEQRRNRRTPLYPCQVRRQGKPSTTTRLRDHYSTQSYGHAILCGCLRAGIPTWHPNQLRHSAATKIRQSHDLAWIPMQGEPVNKST